MIDDDRARASVLPTAYLLGSRGPLTRAVARRVTTSATTVLLVADVAVVLYDLRQLLRLGT